MTLFLGLVMFVGLGQGYSSFEAHFYQKHQLIEAYNRLRMKIGDRVFPQVLVGENRWLEYIPDGNLNDFQNFSGSDPQILSSIQQKLITLNEQLKQRNITLVVVIAPNKATIYPEYMPGEIKKAGEKSRLDQFLALMGNDSRIVLDLRPDLQAGRKTQHVYYRTDTHWNPYGAYIAYQQIMNSLSVTHPDLAPFALDNFILKEKPPEPLDLVRILGADFLTESLIVIKPKFRSNAEIQWLIAASSRKSVAKSWASDNGQDIRLLMYHDSFGLGLIPFFQHHFREATYIQLDLNSITLSAIDRYQPDVVIIEIVERGLGLLDLFLSNQ